MNQMNKRCAFRHEFNAKPYTILMQDIGVQSGFLSWNYDEVAKHNPFFTQVWCPNHYRDESNFYPEDCYQDIVE